MKIVQEKLLESRRGRRGRVVNGTMNIYDLLHALGALPVSFSPVAEKITKVP